MKSAKSSPREAEQVAADGILPEYDFSKSSPNPYAGRYASGTLAITLDPDVPQVSPSAEQATHAQSLSSAQNGTDQRAVGPSPGERQARGLALLRPYELFKGHDADAEVARLKAEDADF